MPGCCLATWPGASTMAGTPTDRISSISSTGLTGTWDERRRLRATRRRPAQNEFVGPWKRLEIEEPFRVQGPAWIGEAMHGREFTKRGGTLEIVQLWVNLPAKDKKGPPHYQSITAAQIPEVPLPGNAGTVRVIAGSHNGVAGPARTFTSLNLWDVRLN